MQIIDGGWHFSFLQNARDIANKIKSYSHGEFNTKDNVDIEKINQKIINNFEQEIKNFYQVCPKEMIEKLENPITNKQKSIAS